MVGGRNAINMNITPEDLDTCLKVLQQISDDPMLAHPHQRLKCLIAKIYKTNKKKTRKTRKEKEKAEDTKATAMTAMVRSQQQQQPFALPEGRAFSKKLLRPNHCYVCKHSYTDLHFFYHNLCPTCADLNYQKRSQSTDLTGRVALVTGGRIKIGYQTALKMLRDGAKVIVTTRFPTDAARHFHAESDFECWHSRLQIYGLDLRHLGAIEAFVRHLDNSEAAIDIIINNAAQTIKRPIAFYQYLLAQEKEEFNQFLPAKKINKTNLPKAQTEYCKSLLPLDENFSVNRFDADGQPIDLRKINSWRLKLDEVSTEEMLEVQLVNTIAPFILNSQLKPLMMRSPFERRFIINVSAMEGQFNRQNKTVHHPHTNMAKAAVNMMTRTSANDYACDRIYMNSVDTGWVTDENPYPQKTRLQQERGFYTPLDAIDGMARIYDPIVRGIEEPEIPFSGYFLKDY
jgi:NAD(P)-dependent dehydrogenase (short-subunit alcohol dehydrogenase family)